MSKVFYGLNPDEMTDVTTIAMEKCIFDEALVIPIGDPQRSDIFGDPYYGQLKTIFIVDVDGNVVTHDHMTPVNVPQFA